MPLVSIGKDWHHVLGEDGKLMKVKAGHPSYQVTVQPKLVRAQTQVDSKKHGHPTLHGSEAQHDLIHGIDFAKKVGSSGPRHRGATSERAPDVTGWYQSDEGHLAYVKPHYDAMNAEEDDRDFGVTHREAAYSRLAHDFFGLGEHVPVSTVFRHPVTGGWYSAQKRVEGEHYSPTSMYHKEMLGQLARSGQLDKLGLMDMLLHQTDRHWGNGLIDKDGVLQHIDNGQAFSKSHISQPKTNDFWSIGHSYNDGDRWYVNPLHPSAVEWLRSLDPQKMAEQMDRLGVPKEERDESVRRLIETKKRVGRGNISRGASMAAPFLMPRNPAHAHQVAPPMSTS
jgi:hypothetical protein